VRRFQTECSYITRTGHGIGSFLTVHEGPVGIASSPLNTTPLQPGHIVSNEPGFYKEGSFGVRIESAVLVQQCHRGWHKFERLTRVPIQTSLVDFSLLSRHEAAWLKAHNEGCKADVLPLLVKTGDKRAVKWLKSQ
jgi:Xaa-Pro aminopeptidase